MPWHPDGMGDEGRGMRDEAGQCGNRYPQLDKFSRGTGAGERFGPFIPAESERRAYNIFGSSPQIVPQFQSSGSGRWPQLWYMASM